LRLVAASGAGQDLQGKSQGKAFACPRGRPRGMRLLPDSSVRKGPDSPRGIHKQQEAWKMTPVWEDLKNGLKKTLHQAKEKGEELAATTKIKVEIASDKREMDKNYQNLGIEVFELFTASKKKSISLDPQIQQYIDNIVGLKKSIEDKEAEIRRIKAENKPETPAQDKSSTPTQA
jgi:hypothetical protein